MKFWRLLIKGTSTLGGVFMQGQKLQEFLAQNPEAKALFDKISALSVSDGNTSYKTKVSIVKEKVAYPQVSEYKGNSILTISNQDNTARPFSFGKSKAKLILSNIEVIKKFAEEGD
jgi:uncharacterized protein YerC